MSEIINTYKLDNPFVSIPMDREEFYQKQIEIFKKGEKPTRSVEVVNILLFNSEGEITIQKRSYNKKHNPGLLDKSIGGHIQYGDVSDYTVIVETVQELQTPSIVLRNNLDFEKTYKLLKGYLETLAIIKHLDTKITSLTRVFSEGKIEILNKANIYIGVYDGRIKPVDREAKGVLFYSLSELEKETQQTPEIFTDDLLFILKEYKEEIKNFVEYITKK